MIDLLLTNARVLSMDPVQPRASAIGVQAGRVFSVGDGDELPPARRVVDLDGAVVTPGFHDAHNHMAWFGLNLLEIDLGTPPIDRLGDVYAKIADRAASAGPDDWIIGSGYDQNKIGGHPDRAAVDRAAGGRKVWLKHTSGHLCMINSPVLAELGLADTGREVAGGAVVVDDRGRPTGLLQERAQLLVADLVLPYPLAGLEDAIERAGRQYLREGITSVTEAGIAGGWIGKSPVELAAYQDAYDHGRLPVRVELMVAQDALHPLAAHPDDGRVLGLDLGIRTGFGDDWLRLGPVKVFADGSLIGRTAAMCCDFADAAGNRGFLQAEPGQLRTAIIDAHRSGWRVATHAIGDAAIELVLDAYEEAQARFPVPDPRHRIEHFGVSSAAQVARTAKLGIVPVPQGRFVNEIGDGMIAALGPERVRLAYRQRSLLDAGLCLPGSSDRPVVDGAPLRGIQDLVIQRTETGRPFNPGEALSPDEALHAFTMGSAYASKAEQTKGSITAGKLADLTVLSDDPTTIEAERIADIAVLATYVAGERVFDLNEAP